MSLRIAIVSDLHCHHSSSGGADTLLLSDLPRRPERQHPVSALQLLIKERHLNADILMAPGDFTNRADQQGMNSAWGFIEAISISLKANVVASTLGNHDVIWKTPSDDAFKIARELLPQFPTEDDAEFKCFWSDGYYFIEKVDYRILVLNSVKHYTNEVSAKRGLITVSQIESIDRYLDTAEIKPLQLALCHHHPIQHEEIDLGPNDLMENGSQFVEMLSRRRFDFLVHGHKHHPRLRVDTSGGNSLVILAAGSFSAGMTSGLGTRSRNVFHMLELHSRANGFPNCSGQITTWQFQHQRGWTEASQSAADFPHLAGFGSMTPAESLANQIEVAFRHTEKEVLHWSTMLTTLPELAWVPPTTFKSVDKLLRARGIELSPSAPDRPNYIGMPV